MNKLGIFLLFFFCLTAVLPAWGRREAKKTAEPEQGRATVQIESRAAEQEEKSTLVEVTGLVRLVMGGIFPELVITGTDREWYVVREEDHILKDLQHRTVTVEGEETVINLTFASGLPAGERRTLRNIKIISIE